MSLGRIALGGLGLLMLSGCISNLPRDPVVLAADGPVVDESLPARQTGRGTDPTRELTRSMAQAETRPRARAATFGATRDAAGAPIEMRAAPPQARPNDAVSILDRLEARSRGAARSICERC